MPMKDPSIYGPNWQEISYAEKERAGWRCECRGQCGLEHGKKGERCPAFQGQVRPFGRRPVILTVHHVNQIPWDHRSDNLLVLCEGCHNRLDMPMRQKHARETRRAAKRLQSLFGSDP